MGDRSNDDRVVAGVSPTGESRAARRGQANEQARAFAIGAAGLLQDLHFEDVLILDVRGLSDVTDYILIASGTSNRQIKSVGGDVQRLGRDMGLERYGRDEDDEGSWLVLDFVDVVVHLFEPVTRSHYDLETMWGDAPRVPWQR